MSGFRVMTPPFASFHRRERGTFVRNIFQPSRTPLLPSFPLILCPIQTTSQDPTDRPLGSLDIHSNPFFATLCLLPGSLDLPSFSRSASSRNPGFLYHTTTQVHSIVNIANKQSFCTLSTKSAPLSRDYCTFTSLTLGYLCTSDPLRSPVLPFPRHILQTDRLFANQPLHSYKYIRSRVCCIPFTGSAS